MKFVFDLDGTICFKGQPISDKILHAFEMLMKEGHEVIFASARPIRDMLPVIDKKFHHFTMVGGNGSLISIEEKIIYSKAFSKEEISEIFSLIDEYNATYLIDGEWDYAYTGSNNHPILQNVDPKKLANMVSVEALTSIVKILLLSANDMAQLSEKLLKLNVFVNVHGNENVLDISSKGINKWSALQHLGITKGSYIAFGNDANDISMFENALHTVMIGYHTELAHLAKETISVERDVEQEIAEKLIELSKMYPLLRI